MKNKNIEELKELVEHGNTDAMNELAYRYGTGNGCERNDEKSIELLKRAVQLGSKKAQYNLAVSYYYGRGITKDVKTAFEMFKELSEKYEHKKSNYFLGEIYYLGKAIEKDYEKAFKYITNALEYDSDDKDAKYYLAKMLYSGQGTEKNIKKAIELFEELYQKFEDRDALMMLADAYYYSPEQNYEKAYKYCSKILEEADKYIKSKDDEYWTKRTLGQLYYFGQYVEQDFKKALDYYMDIVEMDNSGMISYHIGWMNYEGQGTPKNLENSFVYFKQSAENGFSFGQFMLAQAYLCGEGTACDDNKAVYWFEQASLNGYSKAQYKLGMIYYYGEDNGLSIKKDTKYAIQLFKKAAEGGSKEAVAELDKLGQIS